MAEVVADPRKVQPGPQNRDPDIRWLHGTHQCLLGLTNFCGRSDTSGLSWDDTSEKHHVWAFVGGIRDEGKEGQPKGVQLSTTKNDVCYYDVKTFHPFFKDLNQQSLSRQVKEAVLSYLKEFGVDSPSERVDRDILPTTI